MEVHLVADTNLFFEFRRLEDLPWIELGFDPIVILLTKPVLEELDKHKSGASRTRKRALEIYSRVREILKRPIKEEEIQSSSPRVVLRLAANVQPDPSLDESLNYEKNDERLVGIVSALNGQASGNVVKLFTDDTGPAATADSLNVPYILIDERWRRPPAETTEEKKIKDLEKDLSTYRAQEPDISISIPSLENEENFITVTRTIAVPLSEDEVDQCTSALLSKHPIVEDFTPPAQTTGLGLYDRIAGVEYVSPTEDEIANYRDILYPKWVEDCRVILRKLHESRNELEPPIVLSWRMSNIGTRPASQVRVEFEAKGALEICLRDKKNDQKDSKVDGVLSSSFNVDARFPSPPAPPKPKKHFIPSETSALSAVKRVSDSRLTQSFWGIPSDKSTLSAIARANDSLFTRSWSGLSPHINKMAEDYQRVFRRLNIDQQVMAEPVAVFSRKNDLNSLDRLRFSQPNAERFYYDNWNIGQRVKKGALTCKLWRHRSGDEVFEFDVLFVGDGDAKGVIECTVHAENLTYPKKMIVRVAREVQHRSMVEVASAMIERCTVSANHKK